MSKGNERILNIVNHKGVFDFAFLFSLSRSDWILSKSMAAKVNERGIDVWEIRNTYVPLLSDGEKSGLSQNSIELMLAFHKAKTEIVASDPSSVWGVDCDRSLSSVDLGS